MRVPVTGVSIAGQYPHGHEQSHQPAGALFPDATYPHQRDTGSHRPAIRSGMPSFTATQRRCAHQPPVMISTTPSAAVNSLFIPQSRSIGRVDLAADNSALPKTCQLPQTYGRPASSPGEWNTVNWRIATPSKKFP